MSPAELRDRIAALAPAIEAGDDDALAQAIALQRGGRHSFRAKPAKAAKKRAAKGTTAALLPEGQPTNGGGELLPTSASSG